MLNWANIKCAQIWINLHSDWDYFRICWRLKQAATSTLVTPTPQLPVWYWTTIMLIDSWSLANQKLFPCYVSDFLYSVLFISIYDLFHLLLPNGFCHALYSLNSSDCVSVSQLLPAIECVVQTHIDAKLKKATNWLGGKKQHKMFNLCIYIRIQERKDIFNKELPV